jgi:hypothetical protein
MTDSLGFEAPWLPIVAMLAFSAACTVLAVRSFRWQE